MITSQTPHTEIRNQAIAFCEASARGGFGGVQTLIVPMLNYTDCNQNCNTNAGSNSISAACQERQILMQAGMESITNGLDKIKFAIDKITPLDKIFKGVYNLIFRAKPKQGSIEASVGMRH